MGLTIPKPILPWDAKHVGIEGVSRYGKATLITMAYDQRFAMALVGSSGKGGATPLRRNFGEAVESLAGGEFYWMAGSFMKFAAAEGDLRKHESGRYSRWIRMNSLRSVLRGLR